MTAPVWKAGAKESTMTIIINKNKPTEKRYTTEELKAMSKAELKDLKTALQLEVEAIGYRKTEYINNNTEELNSKVYWQKISNYKKSCNILRKEILYLKGLEREKNQADSIDREHWLWCFYNEASKELKSKAFQKLIAQADERAGEHIEIETKEA